MARLLNPTLPYDVPLRHGESCVDALEQRLEHIAAQRRMAAERCEAFLSMLERHMEVQQLEEAAAHRDPGGPLFLVERNRESLAHRDCGAHSPSWQPRRFRETGRRATEPPPACPTHPNPSFRAPWSPRADSEVTSHRRSSDHHRTSSARLRSEPATRDGGRSHARGHSSSAISLHPSSPLGFPSEDLTCGFYAKPRSISRANSH